MTDLTADRIGNRVVLRWTTLAGTIDGLAVRGAMTAQICRETGPRPGTPAARPAARAASCVPVLRLTVAPGPSEVADTLPPNLLSDPVVLLTYRVEILNSVERSAGESPAAFAAAGAAPQPIDSLNGTASAQGVVLDWTAPTKLLSDPIASLVELTRTDLSPPSAMPKPAKPAKTRPRDRGKPATASKSNPQSSGEVHLLTHEPPSGTVDATAKFGETYTYAAERLRPVGIGPHSLNIRSGPSSPVTIAFRDTFPPQSPVGLSTISERGNAASYIDLSWEPNTESDLAGYLVYRQLVGPNVEPQGPSARLTPTPVTSPAYRDVAVSPGQRYIYWVTAVDASGNESAPSAKAQEVVTPERN